MMKKLFVVLMCLISMSMHASSPNEKAAHWSLKGNERPAARKLNYDTFNERLLVAGVFLGLNVAADAYSGGFENSSRLLYSAMSLSTVV